MTLGQYLECDMCPIKFNIGSDQKVHLHNAHEHYKLKHREVSILQVKLQENRKVKELMKTTLITVKEETDHLKNSLEEYKKRETSLLAEIDDLKREKDALDKELRNVTMKSKKADTEKDTLMKIYRNMNILLKLNGLKNLANDDEIIVDESQTNVKDQEPDMENMSEEGLPQY